jgi:hypothetical protein
MTTDIVFNVPTPIGFNVRTTRDHWKTITAIKHPSMKGQEVEVKNTLADPDEIRQSRRDSGVFLFYRLQRPTRWICAVVRRLNQEGFLITAYLTDSIKEGNRIWKK